VNFILRYASQDILTIDIHSIVVHIFQEGATTQYLQSQPISLALNEKIVPSVLIELEVVRQTTP